MADPDTLPLDPSPFHPGELAAQERVGVRERVDRGGRRMIRDRLPEEFREFLGKLSLLMVGSLDPEGRPWASLLNGDPGFVTAPTADSLLVAGAPERGDPLAANLRSGAALGLLGIELETRRRVRVNGSVVWLNEHGFELHVEQAFGNCRKYIHARTRGVERPPAPSSELPVIGGGLLSAAALALLDRSDTCFLASASAHATRGGREGVDVSHRGGPAGFVRAQTLTSGTRLTLPDYTGNFMFNTLGNIEVNPRAGLLACDFASGHLLSLTGRARVIWSGPEIGAFAGADRLLELDVESHVVLPNSIRNIWS
jgi:predicted pyridoxine 5'-phosphate oxidase superfamily flavin-nucleotide-binding protein